uniref:ORF 7 n=1 Tax=Agrobacterium tumefaciens TaxID=358 RepID=Q44466_AGRTU|nr:ORF 7 [Agrobacterium tumefaciens]
MLVGLKVRKVALKSAGRLCTRRNAARNAPLFNGQIPPILFCMTAEGSEPLSELLMNAGVRGNARPGKISSWMHTRPGLKVMLLRPKRLVSRPHWFSYMKESRSDAGNERLTKNGGSQLNRDGKIL